MKLYLLTRARLRSTVNILRDMKVQNILPQFTVCTIAVCASITGHLRPLYFHLCGIYLALDLPRLRITLWHYRINKRSQSHSRPAGTNLKLIQPVILQSHFVYIISVYYLNSLQRLLSLALDCKILFGILRRRNYRQLSIYRTVIKILIWRDLRFIWVTLV